MSRSAELQVSLEDLHELYPAVVRSLGEVGEGGARIAELTGQHLRVQCVGCGERVTAGELEQLSLLGVDRPASDPRLERLRLAYCARQGCNSRYYVCLADSGMVAWPEVFQRVRHQLDQPAAAEADALGAGEAAASRKGLQGAVDRVTEIVTGPADRPLPFRERWRRIQFAVLAGVVGVGLLFWWWNSGARIPGVTPKERKFEVLASPGDPAVIPVPSPGAASGTNAPRAFRVQ